VLKYKSIFIVDIGEEGGVMGTEARLYTKADKGAVDCLLCSFYCHIAEGKTGVCGVRENIDGTLYTLVYRKLISSSSDPIEKKPFFHLLPASKSFSIATVGCNFRCLHCQNSEISQMPRDHHQIIGEDISPKAIVEAAKRESCKSIAYTYTEPTIFFEYAYDTAILAKEQGLKNLFVTNGYMTAECLDALDGILDAANVDLKSFNDKTYKKLCGARLAPVLDSIVKMREMGLWVEVTTLIIPGVNDSEAELAEIARWIYKTDPKMPWHISAFYPTYKLLDKPRTPVSIIDRAREIGLEQGLRYVYTGNVPGDKGESTYCYNCKDRIIERHGFQVLENLVKDSKCPSCGVVIDGVWF
jgi:pyruvate formate lyase activating enzyme